MHSMSNWLTIGRWRDSASRGGKPRDYFACWGFGGGKPREVLHAGGLWRRWRFRCSLVAVLSGSRG